MSHSASPVSRKTPRGVNVVSATVPTKSRRHVTRGDDGHRLRKRARWGDGEANVGASLHPHVSEEKILLLSALQRIIPDDILSRILFGGYIDGSILRASQLSGVCRRFRSLALKSAPVLDLSLGALKCLTTRDFSNFVERYRGLREVNLSDCPSFNDRQLALLSPLNLHVLKLRGTLVSDNGLVDFFKYNLSKPTRFQKCQAKLLHANKSGNIKVCDEAKFESPAIIPLEILDLSNNSRNWKGKVTDKTLAAIACSCPELKVLRMSWCEGITDEFLDFIPKHLKKLQVLDLSNCSITAKGCRELARSSSLRSVDVSACQGIDGRAIWALATGELRAKEHDGDLKGDDDEEMGLASIRETSVFSPLESIAARFAVDIDAEVFDMLSSRAPKLTRLDLRNYMGDMLVSPQLRQSIRKLKRNGVHVAIKS